MEDYAVMAGSIVAAEAVPGLGEVQLGIQFLDFIDPFGYNQALNRKQVDSLLTTQYQKIQDMQTAIGACYATQGADTDSCTKAGITSDQMTTFQSYPQAVQDKLVKTRTSWLYPTNPVARYSQTFGCMIATDPGFMATNCQDPDYKKLYMDYWNANEAKFQADAAAAEKAAAQAAAAGLVGDGGQDDANSGNKKKMQLMLAGIFIIAVIIIFLLTNKITKSIGLP
jgi:hypothetical protein